MKQRNVTQKCKVCTNTLLIPNVELFSPYKIFVHIQHTGIKF